MSQVRALKLVALAFIVCSPSANGQSTQVIRGERVTLTLPTTTPLGSHFALLPGGATQVPCKKLPAPKQNQQTQPPLDPSFIATHHVHSAYEKNEVTYAAQGEQGLVLYNTSGEKPQWLSSHQNLGNLTTVKPFQEKVIGANAHNELFLIDVQNSTEPTIVSSFYSKEKIKSFDVYQNQIMVNPKEGGYCVDFTPIGPALTNKNLDSGQGVNYGGQRRIFIANNIAYVADWFSGIHVYDISQTDNPKLLSSYNTPGSAKGVVVDNNVAYVADDDHGLQILDVTDPTQPKLIANVPTEGLAYTPKLVENTLYLASHRGGVYIIDVTNPKKPAILSHTLTGEMAWSLSVKNSYMYVANDGLGLLIFDISNKAEPKLISQFNPGGDAEEVLIKNNVAFVSFFDQGLFSVDISNPHNPRLLDHFLSPGNARGIDIKGNFLYLADWLAGLHILDIAQPNKLKLLGTHDTRGAAWGVQVKNNVAYIMDWWNGFTVVDVKLASTPKHLAYYPQRSTINDIVTQGRFAFAAHENGGVQVYEISNPLNPTWVTGVDLNCSPSKLYKNKNRLFALCRNNQMAAINIKNPFAAYLLHEQGTPKGTRDIALIENRLVLSARNILFTSGLKTPFNFVKSLQLSGNITALHSDGDTLTAAQGKTVLAFSLSKGKLKETGQTHTEHPIKFIRHNKQHLFMATDKQLLMFARNNFQLQKTPPFLTTLDEQPLHLQSTPMGAIVSTTSGLMHYHYSHNKDTLTFHSLLPTPSPYVRFSTSNNILYASGQKEIRARKLLPKVEIHQLDTHKVSFTVPDDLPVGAYHLLSLTAEAKQKVHNNVVNVVVPRFSKPKMTLEQFKKLYAAEKLKRMNAPPN